MVEKKVAEYIKQEKLLSGNEQVLVALSGGADSVALLLLLVKLGYRCGAAHCNFHLRGRESDRDEQFVRELCEQQGVRLHVAQFDTLAYASRNKISVEMAARELRYNFFCEIIEQHFFTQVAVALHRGVSVETVLINLIRGTGIKGLTGIKPLKGDIVRPLLCLSRKEILNYLSSCNQTFVMDSSNLQNHYVRNKIRLDILPLMKQINPSVEESIADMARKLTDVAEVYRYCMEQGRTRAMENGNIRIDRLLAEPAPRSLLFEILSPLGFNPSRIEDVWDALKGAPGKSFYSKKWVVIKDRDLLLLHSIDEQKRAMRMEDLQFRICETGTFRMVPCKEMAYLDADKLEGEWRLRKWQKGDWFIPFGMKGRKRLSDYMTDRKYSLLDKQQQYVLLSGEQVVWLVGERLDDRFKITPSTRKVLIIEIKPASSLVRFSGESEIEEEDSSGK